MADIMIVSQGVDGSVRHVTLQGSKFKIFVGYWGESKMWNVVALNASHAAYRGSGRLFESIEKAADAYKSPESKALIREAGRLIGEVGKCTPSDTTG